MHAGDGVEDNCAGGENDRDHDEPHEDEAPIVLPRGWCGNTYEERQAAKKIGQKFDHLGLPGKRGIVENIASVRGPTAVAAVFLSDGRNC